MTVLAITYSMRSGDPYRRPLKSLLAAREQIGFGLIELMVSLAIASFLVLGLVTMAGSMQNTYTQQTNLALLHDKERFASALFANVLQVGGYTSLSYSALNPPPSLNDGALTQVLTANAPGQTYASQQYISGSGDPSGNGPDVLNVRYYDSGTDTPGANCLGEGFSNGIYESVLSIVNNNLVCQVGQNGGTPAATPGGAAGSYVIMIDGVTNMQLLFNYFDGAQYQYYRAIDMISTKWPGVKSVTVKLTFNDPVICSTAVTGGTLPPSCTFSQTYQVMYGSP